MPPTLPRRPQQTYGGPEERTPLPMTMNERVMVLDAHADRAFEAIEKLSNNVDSILEIINGPNGKPEDGLLSKMYVLDQRRRNWDRVVFACATALAVALIGFLARISFLVQAAKITP